jgi:hypothetical protein
VIFVLGVSFLQGSFSKEHNYYFKSVIGYSVGVVVLISIMLRPSSSNWLERCLTAVLIIHVTAFLLQFGVLQTTGIVLDFVQPVTGETSRVFGGALARCTGLWVEPAMYATFIFGMVIVHVAAMGGRFGIIDGIVLLTIVISRSTTGIVLVGFFTLLMVLTRLRGATRLAGFGTLVCAAVIIAWLMPENVLESFSRIEFMSDDNSAVIRFYGLAEQIERMSPIELLFGLGIGSPVALTTGHNGLYMNLVGLGCIGFCLFWGGVAMIIGSRKLTSTLLIAWAPSLLGAPQQTWAYWWFVLGFAAYFSRRLGPPRGEIRPAARAGTT